MNPISKSFIVAFLMVVSIAAQAKDLALKEIKYSFYDLAGSKIATINCRPKALAGTMVVGIDDTKDLSQILSFTFTKSGMTEQKEMVQDGWMPVLDGDGILFEKQYQAVDKFEVNDEHSVTFSFYLGGVDNALRAGPNARKLQYTIGMNEGCVVHKE